MTVLVGLGTIPVSPSALAHNNEQKARLRPSIVGSRGDKDATGRAEIKSSAEIDTLCYKVWFKNMKPATSAHIHQAVAGQNGEIVVTLFESKRKSGFAQGCDHNVEESLLESMQASPQGYYLDIHNKQYPKGALRGQLQNVHDAGYLELCDPYKPESEAARKVGTLIVNNGHTDSEPLSVTINAPEGTASDPQEVLINVQLTSQGQEVGLYVRYEFPITEDYDIFVLDGNGDEKARADGVNPNAVGPLTAPNDNGGHSEQGAEQIDGLRTAHCTGYTLRLVTNSGAGGKLALKLWTGEAAQ